MGIIYMLTFPSGKSYIGQTVTSFKDRFNKHLSSAKCNQGGCHLLNHAINKYGVDNIQTKFLIECDDEVLNEYENKYVKEYNTLVPNGYNLIEGGIAPNNKQKHRATLSEIHKRKYQEDEKIRNHIKQNGHNTKKNKSLPDYMTEERDYKKDKVIGYRVYRHPMCQRAKKFCSLKVSLDENYKKALEYLHHLNTLTEPIEFVEAPVIGRKKASDNNLPKYVMEKKGRDGCVKGYVVNIRIKGLQRKLKEFINPNMTMDDKLKLAIEFKEKSSIQLENEKAQRLNGNGAETP